MSPVNRGQGVGGTAMTKSRPDSRANGTSPRYIPCQVEPGMFKGEYLAYIEVGTQVNPETKVKAQLLVDHQEVKGLSGTPRRNAPVQGYLRVEVADTRVTTPSSYCP